LRKAAFIYRLPISGLRSTSKYQQSAAHIDLLLVKQSKSI